MKDEMNQMRTKLDEMNGQLQLVMSKIGRLVEESKQRSDSLLMQVHGGAEADRHLCQGLANLFEAHVTDVESIFGLDSTKQ
jgi:hypothetical protein